MRVSRRILAAFRQWALPLAAGAALCSCADDEGIEGGLSPAIIAFDTSINDKPRSRADDDTAATQCVAVKRFEGGDSLYLHTIVSGREGEAGPVVSRAAPVKELSEYGSFGVFAYLYEGAWDDAKESLQHPYMNNVEVAESNDGYWAPASVYYWPAQGRSIRFFAYAPFNAASYNGGGNIAYHVPSDVAEQKDLMAASSEEYEGGGSHGPVSLRFRHLLTAVKFSVGDDMASGRISKITLSGLYANGIYDFDSASWKMSGLPNFAFSQTLDKRIDGTPDTEITAGDATFMMLPQKLPEGAKIAVEFTDDISHIKNTIDADISGTVWEPGKIVDYRLSTTSIEIIPTFKVEVANNGHFSHKGGTSTIKVTSYADFKKEGTSVQTKSMPWTAKFYGYNASTGQYDQPLASRPSWITDFTDASGESANLHIANCTVAEQSYQIVDESTTNLRKAATKGSTSNRWNLSTKGGSRSMTTANCYVVDAPGYYCLPLIYGNAIKNGYYNTSAYTCSASASAGNLNNFIRHDGNAITNPYILANFTGPFTAELGWTDIPGGCITVMSNTTNYTLTVNGASQSGIPHIHFNVNKSNITSGNALILLKKDGVVVWSWHIWITDMVDESIAIGGNKKMLPVLLGWSHDGIRRYNERSVKVIYTQEESNATKEIMLIQDEYEDGDYGTCTFYQWGRKDPLLGRIGNSNITWYDKYNNTRTEMLTVYPSGLGTPAITAFIKNPWAFSNNPSARPGYHNMWSQTNNKAHAANSSGVKTVYDPCPPGYRVPVNKEFTDALINNNKRSWDKVRKTWRFTTNISGKTAFFPMVGARDKTGKLIGFQDRCHVWSAETFPIYSYLFFINSSRLWLSNPDESGADGDYTSNGASIIAIGE